MNYLLFNKKAKNRNSIEKVADLKEKYNCGEVVDVIGLNVDEFLAKLSENDEVTLVGGDGTLNKFVNNVDGKILPCKFYFFSAGTGNDFLNDMKDHAQNDRIYLNDLIKNLPTVFVNGESYKFINGIGYGIDGYCCEVGDELQKTSTKPVNYTSIAIKGLLFHYKAPNAKVTVDGVTKEYKKVWLAPTMKGRFYGGGMMVAPSQNRFDENGLLTNVVLHHSGKIHTLMVFPKIFKGEHVKHTKMVDVRTGKHFIVEFDAPQALQVDGETIVGVTKYEVRV